MKIKQAHLPYFCVHCRKERSRFEEMYVVEEDHQNLFCEEECIVDFYRPLIDLFNRQEMSFRRELGLTQEPALNLLKKLQLSQEVLTSPDEIWGVKRAHQDTYYSLISRLRIQEQDFFLVTICLSFKGRPSFILHQSLTQNGNIINYYRQGIQLNDLEVLQSDKGIIQEEVVQKDGQVKVELSPEDIEGMEQKKSELLGQMLIERAESDIPPEEFPLFDKYLPETVQAPDEAYVYQDKGGDEVFIHIKSYSLNKNQSFFYLALCQSVVLEQEQGEGLMIPIISFPTIDPNLVKFYRRGEKLQGGLKN